MFWLLAGNTRKRKNSPFQPCTSLSDLSVAQLQRAIVLKQKIEALEGELAAVFAGRKRGAVKGRRRTRSQGHRKSVAALAPAPVASNPKPRRKANAALSKRLSELAKARWKKAKAAGKSRL